MTDYSVRLRCRFVSVGKKRCSRRGYWRKEFQRDLCWQHYRIAWVAREELAGEPLTEWQQSALFDALEGL
jgi:hypothetical protein